MSDLIALLMWLTGQVPQEPTPNNDPEIMRPMGGGIPIEGQS